MLASYFNLLFLGKLVGLHQVLVFEPCALIPHVKTPHFLKNLKFLKAYNFHNCSKLIIKLVICYQIHYLNYLLVMFKDRTVLFSLLTCFLFSTTRWDCHAILGLLSFRANAEIFPVLTDYK